MLPLSLQFCGEEGGADGARESSGGPDRAYQRSDVKANCTLLFVTFIFVLSDNVFFRKTSQR